MKAIIKTFVLAAVLAPISARAADFGYGPPIHAPYSSRIAIERPAPQVVRDITIERRVVAQPQREMRIIERKIVQGPHGVVKTTRIYERYSPSTPAPIPPRDIPLASAPYFRQALRQTYIQPRPTGFITAPAPIYNEWEEEGLE